jgi:hypothetical protein
MGAGPMIGHFSTPFARVVLAALAARKDGKGLAIADLTPDILALGEDDPSLMLSLIAWLS